jgi:hypothetical protein
MTDICPKNGAGQQEILQGSTQLDCGRLYTAIGLPEIASVEVGLVEPPNASNAASAWRMPSRATVATWGTNGVHP